MCNGKANAKIDFSRLYIHRGGAKNGHIQFCFAGRMKGHSEVKVRCGLIPTNALRVLEADFWPVGYPFNFRFCLSSRHRSVRPRKAASRPESRSLAPSPSARLRGRGVVSLESFGLQFWLGVNTDICSQSPSDCRTCARRSLAPRRGTMYFS